MTYLICKQLTSKAEMEYSDATKEINKYPKNTVGLTPDSVRNTQEWKKSKYRLDKAFTELKYFNSMLTKVYKAEYRKDRLQRGINHAK